MNFKAIEKKDKSMLSKKNIKARLAFAKKYIYWSVNDCNRVIWSDEWKSNRFLTGGRQWAWARKGKTLKTRHVHETVKFGGGSVMLWGCFTVYDVGSLIRIKGRMNQYMYSEILDVNLRETIQSMLIELYFGTIEIPSTWPKVCKNGLGCNHFKFWTGQLKVRPESHIKSMGNTQKTVTRWV